MVFEFLHGAGWWSPFIVLVSVGVSMILTQLVKFIREPESLKSFRKDGGMPSTHATIIGSSLTGIFLVQGLSMLFVLACAVGIIVIRDAFGVRYAVGENAKVLKENSRGSLKKRVIIDEGHTPRQIIVGFVMGACVAALFIFFTGSSVF